MHKEIALNKQEGHYGIHNHQLASKEGKGSTVHKENYKTIVPCLPKESHFHAKLI